MNQQESAKPASRPIYIKGLAQEDEAGFQPILDDEFPDRKGLLEIDRRSILKFLGGALALAGLPSGCRFLTPRKIVPFVQQPQDAQAGVARMYASSAQRGGYGIGLLVTNNDGRPTKLDGNPNHGSSLGSIDSKTQAEILNLYDPDRLKLPTMNGEPVAWKEVLAACRAALDKSVDGSGVTLLTEAVGSPSYAAQIKSLLAKYPKLTWRQYESASRDNVREGARLAFGQDVDTVHSFAKANVVVALDANFIFEGPGNVRYSRDLMSRRHPDAVGGMTRIYAFESQPTLVGVVSDHRVRVKASQFFALAQGIAAAVGVPGAVSSAPAPADKKVLDAAVKDLIANKGKSIVIVGEHQAPEVHALVHAINSTLGNFGQTIALTEPVIAKPFNAAAEIAGLAADMASAKVRTLLIFGGNPVYEAPGDIDFAKLIERTPLSFHLSIMPTETGMLTTYELPMNHFLESWGDAKGHDGTVAVVQPQIEMLYDSRSEIELIDAFVGLSRTGKEIVESTHKLSATAWRDVLAGGVIPTAEKASLILSPVPGIASTLRAPGDKGALELVIAPDPHIHEGRNANNSWLQELPKPITKLTWDNALLVSYATAKNLGIGQGEKKLGVIPYYGGADLVKLTVDGRSIEVPVWVNLGMADGVMVLHQGYGRSRSGVVGTKTDEEHGGGFNANFLRSSKSGSIVSATVERTGKRYTLANTQYHNTIDTSVVDNDRELIKETTVTMLAAGKPFGKEPEGAKAENAKLKPKDGATPTEADKQLPSAYDGVDFKNNPDSNYQWAMTIDLSLCTGCNACVMACQSENNISTVGKEQVKRGRAMHWIRIDRYYRGTSTDIGMGPEMIDRDNPPMYFQPVTCMQCEQAPCEPVCPVAATVHSHEGLNQMVYNRCVGTRYCSNNCPYKVRRFNFLHFTKKVEEIPVLKMLQNPEVTVRGRGVMEKCTYCVQRINTSRVTAKKEGRLVADGEIQTACQVACPGRAIIFGDKRDPANAVSKSRSDKRNYLLLEETNTRPRTSYLSRVRNPHPELEA